MNQVKPPHRKQTEAPGRKPPQSIDRPRTLRVDPDVWDIAMKHAVRLSGQRGYVCTLKESLADIAREWEQQREKREKGQA